MRLLIAPDSFKGSLSALAAARHMERGARAVFPQAVCDLVPMADGGEGTVDAMVEATGGSFRSLAVSGPLGAPVTARFGILGDGGTAVIEMAAASGLPLLRNEERDPLRTGTYGTGELIRAALAELHAGGHTRRPRLIIGIGGSATNDGGAGAAQALGARFLDKAGRDLPPGGAALADLAALDLTALDPRLRETEILVACDVDNPLCGRRGASAVFGPQKGATPEMTAQLDKALAHYAALAARATGRDIAELPGAGAAGGLGAGLLFFTGASLKPGVEIVLEATNFITRAEIADIVLTGEGRSDFQTAYGKAPVGVAKAAKRFGKPVICVSGALGDGVEAVYEHGIDAFADAVTGIVTLAECMKNAGEMLEKAVERTLRAVKTGMKIGER